MKNLNKLFLLTFVATFTFVSCSDFVSNTDAPINIIADDALTTESQIPFLATGVMARFTQAFDNLSVISGGLSDELQFDADGNSLATFPTFAQIDQGDILFDNNSVDGPYEIINEARFIADDLIRRIGEIGTFEDPTVRDEALYTANLVGGMTRYWLGSYFGLTQTVQGAPIDNSDIIPKADLIAQAITKLDAALALADAPQTKIVNSLKVEIYMSVNDYANAATVLQGSVLESGDAPFQALYNQQSQNAWFSQAGEGRTQFNVNQRFADYITADTTEANRIDIVAFVETVLTPNITYYYHGYDRTAPIDIVTWQEMDLARAEILVDNPSANVGSAGSTPLTLINEVRASHAIPAFVGVVDQDVVIEERDKELFATGNRLLDQLRTNTFHLIGGQNYTLPSTAQTGNPIVLVATPWEHFPITAGERNNNPNF
tara:strand:- start:760 stop:2055 length:1296 start_codon:yes stop_codon:yes gene_type:complete